MYITMNNLADTLVNHIHDSSIVDQKYWKSKFKNVIHDVTYVNADDIVYKYFSKDNAKPKDLDINIINCWFYIEENKFKQYMINNILHILKTNNHQFYNEIEYYLLC